MIFGVTSIISSLFWLLPAVDLNSLPSIGMSPSIGVLVIVSLSSFDITPVSISVCESLTLKVPVSNLLTLRIFIGPQLGIFSILLTEVSLGLNEKVTKPLSSILLTLAPNVKPAFENSASHVVLLPRFLITHLS